MRTRSHILRIVVPLLCVATLIANVQCGEYLFLHYLLTQNCCNSNNDNEAESQTCGQPSANPTVVVQEAPIVEAIPLGDGPGIPLPPPSCRDADLNRDGKVDALDIQIMVNCLLSQ